MKQRSRLIFFGTSGFGAFLLEKLIINDYHLVAIITEPDRPQGRGRKLAPSPVKIMAEKYHIPVSQPQKVKDFELEIRKLGPDLIIVAAYGQIIPRAILNIPQYGCLNIHPSLLPKYRGPTPIQTAILDDEEETGVTIIKMDENIDHGDVAASSKLSDRRGSTNQLNADQRIDDSGKHQISKLNYPELSAELAKLGAKLLLNTLPKYLSGKIKLQPQDHSKATFTKLLKKSDGLLDWRETPQLIERKIRAFGGWPQTYTIIDGRRFIIKQAHLENSNLVIDIIQPEGKKQMAGEAFRRGYPQILTKLPQYVKI